MRDLRIELGLLLLRLAIKMLPEDICGDVTNRIRGGRKTHELRLPEQEQPGHQRPADQ